MTDLKNQVVQGATDLRAIWTELQTVSSSALPIKSYDLWTKRSMLYRILEGTAEILPARDAAWDAVQAVAAPPDVSGREPNKVQHGSLQMDFAIARHIALTSYAAVTWSIYDRLANVCGRLAGIADLAQNPRQNPKACEDFLGSKDIMGFSGHLHIKQGYSWPLKVTYKIRNWLVHEGYEEGGTPLFSGDRISDGFRIHDDAVAYLEKCCGYSIDNGKIDCSCLSAAEECWTTRELLTILSRYHAEVDTMFAGLLQWSVNSFSGQVAAFSARDRF